MQVLVIGSGGREHALAWALSRSPQVTHVFVADGNGGTTWQAFTGEASQAGFAPIAPCESVAIAPNNHTELRQFAQENTIALTVVGPEVPLANGIVDFFQELGLRIFGVSQACAKLEASKAYSKAFMVENGIPTADFFVTQEEQSALNYLAGIESPVVVKADGLASGKGVIVCDNRTEAEQAVHAMLSERAFGVASDTILIEERLVGREFSVLAFCDGKTARLMPVARDHKRALDGDKGLNTGGMGAIAPTNDIPSSLIEEVLERVIQPTLDGMARQNTPYKGVLYAGLMLTENGIKTLEFNCRFGDPETQVLLPLLGSDLVDIFNACIDGTLEHCPITWREGYTACVVLASEGYPAEYPKGRIIHGLETLNLAQGVVFHAGTTLQNGQIVTNGGRVLNITHYSRTLEQALAEAYQTLSVIHFDGMHYRRDIGQT